MLTTEILEAIKNAPETVEVQCYGSTDWISYAHIPISLNQAIHNSQWRIKTKSYDSTHIVWLKDNPEPAPYSDLINLFLLGKDTNKWSPVKTEKYSKKFEIIVREIQE